MEVCVGEKTQLETSNVPPDPQSYSEENEAEEVDMDEGGESVGELSTEVRTLHAGARVGQKT